MLCCVQGSEEQKQQLLPGMADNSLVGCWALTEPSNGSDASALTCTATKVGAVEGLVPASGIQSQWQIRKVRIRHTFCRKRLQNAR